MRVGAMWASLVSEQGQQGLEQKRSVGDTYVTPTLQVKPMRSLLAAGCGCLREPLRVKTDRQKIDLQEQVDVRGPVVQLRRDLTHTTRITWAVGWRVERNLRLAVFAGFPISIGTRASVNLRRPQRLRTLIASYAKQRTEHHPQGDDRDEGEPEHCVEDFL